MVAETGWKLLALSINDTCVDGVTSCSGHCLLQVHFGITVGELEDGWWDILLLQYELTVGYFLALVDESKTDVMAFLRHIVDQTWEALVVVLKHLGFFSSKCSHCSYDNDDEVR